jgi:hypothetical protein
MQPSSDNEARNRALRWLGHGAELARSRFEGRPKPWHTIRVLLEDALQIMERIPDEEKRWLNSASRSGGWSSVGMTQAELAEIERIRVLAGIKPFDGQARTLPQRDDVERALGVLEWLRFCNSDRDPEHRLQKAVVQLARGNTEAAVRIYGNGRMRFAQVEYEVRTKGIGRIISGLRKTLGIVPAADGSGFVEALGA